MCFYCIRPPYCWILFCCVVPKSKARYWHNWKSSASIYKKTQWTEGVFIQWAITISYNQCLELRRLHLDLIFCYKIVFGMENGSFSSFFKFSPVTNTRGHPYKLYKSHCPHSTRSRFFAARVINVWNCLPPSVNYTTLAAFRHSINVVDFSSFLKCDIDWVVNGYMYYRATVTCLVVLLIAFVVLVRFIWFLLFLYEQIKCMYVCMKIDPCYQRQKM